MARKACERCGKPINFFNSEDGYCEQCWHSKFQEEEEAKRREAEEKVAREQEQAAREEAIATLPITTEATIPHVSKRLGVVTGECVLGMNIFRDFTAEIRDVVGGRSGAYQKAIKEAKDTCLHEMKIEAANLGADAVIAVDIDFNEITGGGGLFGGKGMIFVVATGTAVKLANPAD